MMKRMKRSRSRFLVIVRAGDSSLHQEWLKPAKDKNFDLCISCYGDTDGLYKNECEYYFEGKGPKWSGIKKAIEGMGEQIHQYEAIWCPDDDIQTNASNISRMFDLFMEKGFELAQPALTQDSYYSHKVTLQHPDYLWRYSVFVEIMAPIFSKISLEKCLHTFDLNRSGWGIDLLWPKLIGHPDKKIAIIDETSITHKRKIGTGTLYNGDFEFSFGELREIEKKYNVDFSTYKQPHYDGILRSKRVFIVVLAHKDENILAEQIMNIRQFNPDIGIIIYNGGNEKEFARNLKYPICPYSRPIQWASQARVLWDVMRWLEEMDVDYEYLVNFDHDMLFVKHGFENFLEKSMKDFDCMGWQLLKGSEIEKFPSAHVAQSLWDEWHQWQPVFQSKDFLRYFNPGQVYRRSLIKRMLKHLESVGEKTLNDLLEHTRVHALEETFWVTLAKVCGGRCGEYPDGDQYNEAVRWGENISIDEVKRILIHPSYYWIHPIREEGLVQMNRWLITEATGKEARVRKKVAGKKFQEKTILKSRIPNKFNGNITDSDSHHYQSKILKPKEVLHLINQAAHNKQRFSLTRFSHAEITYLCWKLKPDMIDGYEKYRAYSGMNGSVKEVAERIRTSLETADLVGLVPPDEEDNGKWWYAQTKDFLHHIDKMPEKICSVWVSQELIHEKEFWDLLRQRRVALIGRRAHEAVPYFSNEGVNVTEVKSLEGLDEINPVFESMKKSKNWDIALISAAIPATIITPKLARDTGRIVIDFGHALDMIIEGEQYNFQKYFMEWEEKYNYRDENHNENEREDQSPLSMRIYKYRKHRGGRYRRSYPPHQSELPKIQRGEEKGLYPTTNRYRRFRGRYRK